MTELVINIIDLARIGIQFIIRIAIITFMIIVDIIITIILMNTRCDGTKQCPLGDDEEECQLEPLVRFALSDNFIVFANILFIAVIILLTIIIILNLVNLIFFLLQLPFLDCSL